MLPCWDFCQSIGTVRPSYSIFGYLPCLGTADSGDAVHAFNDVMQGQYRYVFSPMPPVSDDNLVTPDFRKRLFAAAIALDFGVISVMRYQSTSTPVAAYPDCHKPFFNSARIPVVVSRSLQSGSHNYCRNVLNRELGSNISNYRCSVKVLVRVLVRLRREVLIGQTGRNT